MAQVTQLIIKHLTKLGFLINWEKSVLIPSHAQEFSWLCFQHQEDVNFGSCAEITEIDDETEASIEPSSSTTDSESNGEDDGDDPSNRGSITIPEIHAEGSSKIYTYIIKIGKLLVIYPTKAKRN
ncbi:hypothetical protein G6F57_009098 [Rhizopus arrhizus]|uniref:Uncharacterized protein n=1 Tax=Rhizopus oryzae TaxID=64495 RepID=A0A9P6X8I9_RHIOR|nr:hypothetical protein G6F23_004278 [Rhizopus arrhizus]KAG1416905.1 hypothetical protein G6F58_005745 [Rhizopus delemar]KAG0759533.1 hypothetical protein G6F24_008993 [Rhizopus arrhizus]KAG0790748.1 hypothetical protein G6F21_005584 [Rhizopus arrhizus]KAG0798987.1 hypothetical protein G6F22_003680 [Rhizopus arrhizus]